MGLALVEDEYGQAALYNRWSIVNTDLDGVIDSYSSRWDVDIRSYEIEFNEDMDGDGAIGNTIANLDELREGKQVGAKLYKNDSDSIFVLREGASTPLLITDESGYPAYIYDSWGEEAVAYTNPGYNNYYGWNKAYAVADLGVGNGYRLAIQHNYSGTVEWELVTVTETGQLDYSDSRWTNEIADSEPLFGEDLNEDGQVG